MLNVWMSFFFDVRGKGSINCRFANEKIKKNRAVTLPTGIFSYCLSCYDPIC